MHRNSVRASLRTSAQVLAAVGALLYLVVTCMWIHLYWSFYQNEPRLIDWASLRHAVPAPLLLGLFAGALVKRDAPKPFALLLGTALLLIAGWSTYDLRHENATIVTHSPEQGWENYHVLGKGAHHYYFNWPWLSR